MSSKSPTTKRRLNKEKNEAKNIKLSNVLILSKNSLKTITDNWKVFSIVTGIYFFCYLLFVRGFGTTVNVSQLKSTYTGDGGSSSLSSDVSAFGKIISTNISSSTSGSASSGLYQTILLIIFSLVFIWMLREVMKGNKITVRDSLYKSQSALIPFLIVCFYITLELLPMVIGLFIYSSVFNNGIAVGAAEKIAWTFLTLLLTGISLWLITSTVFSIYIVTLSDVRPIQALKSSWSLVKKRRMVVLRKVIFLPIAMSLILMLISLIFVAIFPAVSDYIFFILTVSSLVIFHSYLYNLYRELI